jgi:hypothetical protein
LFVCAFSLDVQGHLLESFEGRLGWSRDVLWRFEAHCVSRVCEVDDGGRFDCAHEEHRMRKADFENDL